MGCKGSRVQISALRPTKSVSIPMTWVTVYTGDIADTLALKGLGAHSTRLSICSNISVSPMARTLLGLLILCFTIGAPTSSAQPQQNQILVLAAASLPEAMKEIGANSQKPAGVGVKVSFDASSTLARQIEEGAPADV